MAFRMQTSVPEVTDISQRDRSHVRRSTAPTAASPAPSPPTACSPAAWPSAACASSSSTTRAGTSTATCPTASAASARETDQASAALVTDLKQRGLLDDTLVVWGGEFGRTVYSQGTLTATNYGRDHHPRCFTIWLAGGGIKPGITYGETDDYGYNIADANGNPIVADKARTHARCRPRPRPPRHHPAPARHRPHALTYTYQGRHFRLTDVHGQVVKELLA